MNIEHIDIYDQHRTPRGITKQRGDSLEKGEYRLVVHVCIFNQQGKLLIQQRHSKKSSWPNMWDFSASGGVIAGEKSNEAAERELFEELGIQIDFSNSRPSISLAFHEGFDDFYIAKVEELNLSSLILQQDEVQDALWADREDVLSLLEHERFAPYHSSLINLLFESQDNPGSLRNTK